MTRLQAKAFFASTGVHALLVGILLVGSAFLPRTSRPLETPPGANPPGPVQIICGGLPEFETSTPSTSPVSRPAVTPTKSASPIVPQRAAPVSKSGTAAIPRISLVPKTRNSRNDATDSEDSASSSTTATQQQVLGKLANTLSEAAKGMGGPAGLTSIDSPSGASWGGAVGSSYAELVKQVYTDAWTLPSETAKGDAIVQVRVVISRDGTVKDAKIIGPSGDSALDASIRRTLQDVRFVAEFPPNVRENEKSFTIHFSLRAKRGWA